MSNALGATGLIQRQSRYTHKVIAAFFVGWAIVYADRTSLYPMLGVIGNQFHLTATQTGAITTTYFLVYVAAQIPVGALADRMGAKRLLVGLYLLAGLGLMAVGLLATNYLTLLLFIAIHGVGAGVYYPSAYTVTMNTVPRELRGFSSAIINSGMSVGLALGLAVAGPVYLLTNNWRVPFLALSIPTILMAAVYFVLVRDTRPKQNAPLQFAKILRDKNFVNISIAGFCSVYGFQVAVVWGPTFLQQERGIGLELSGLYTAIIAVAALPAALSVGRFSDVVGRKKVSLIVLPLAAGTIFAFAYVHSLVGLVIALVCYGFFGKLTWDPVAVSWVGDYASANLPEAMGAAIGIFSFAAISSAIIAPIVSGLVKDLTGSLQLAFYLASFVVLMGFVFILRTEEVHGSSVKPGP